MTIFQHHTPDERDPAQMIRLVRAGDPQAFAALYERYADRVYGFVLRLSGNPGDAEDIVQEVFLAAYAGRTGFGGRARLLTWLLGIASRRWRDRCRHKSPQTTPFCEDGSGCSAEIGAMRAPRCLETDVVDALTLESALAHLDGQAREALLLVVSQGLTYREAAEVMEEPVGTTKWRVSQATRKMASAVAPGRVRAAVFSQIPAIETHQNAVYHMQVSLGLDAKAQRRREFRRLVGIGNVTAVVTLSAALIAPHIFPDIPDAGEVLAVKLGEVRDLFDGDKRTLAQDAQRVAALNALLNSPQRNAAFLEKAKRMREQWKPWAAVNKPLLQKLLWNPAQDYTTLLQVYRELPATLPESGDGLTLRELNADGLEFTWQPAAKLSMTPRYNSASPRYAGEKPDVKGPGLGGAPLGQAPSPVAVTYDAASLNNRSKQENQVITTLKVNYNQHHHDIELSRSISTGQTHYSLWVSGRITETTIKLQQVKGRWEPAETIYREICSPYEELTR